MDLQDVHYHTSGDAHYFSAIAFIDVADMVAQQIGGHDALEDKFRRLELQCLLHATRKLPGVAAFSVSFERDRRESSWDSSGERDQLTVDMTYTTNHRPLPKGDKCDNYKRRAGPSV